MGPLPGPQPGAATGARATEVCKEEAHTAQRPSASGPAEPCCGWWGDPRPSWQPLSPADDLATQPSGHGKSRPCWLRVVLQPLWRGLCSLPSGITEPLNLRGLENTHSYGEKLEAADCEATARVIRNDDIRW